MFMAPSMGFMEEPSPGLATESPVTGVCTQFSAVTLAPVDYFGFLLHHLPVKIFLFIFFLTYTYIVN